MTTHTGMVIFTVFGGLAALGLLAIAVIHIGIACGWLEDSD